VGEPTAEVVITDVAQIDKNSTAVGQNLNDQLYENIPVQRSVSSLFYLSPGATDSLGGGRDNPSISGGSALDNLYIADGVNITDSAFGGIGTFTRNYGSLGTGITTAFIKEVQVKTGGFEPQYGQSQGGIVNVITKSGGNDYHGAVYGYAKPDMFEATRRQRDEFSVNKVGASPASFAQLAQEQYDVGADFGGPIAKDKLFFFGSFNPTILRDVVEGSHRNTFDLENGAGAFLDSGLSHLELCVQAGLHHQPESHARVLDLRRSFEDEPFIVCVPEHRQHDGVHLARLWHAQYERALQRRFRGFEPCVVERHLEPQQQPLRRDGFR
jgi:hypothetical protein